MTGAQARRRSENTVPDGGYGWVVCFSAAGTWALVGSTSGLYAALFLDLVDHFDSNKSTIAWIGGMQYLLNAVLIHFLHTPLIKRFGYKWAAMVGPLLCSSGYLISAFTSNVYLLFLTFGAMPGVGSSIMGMSSEIAVMAWFEKKRAIALICPGIGSSLGWFSWAPLTAFLVNLYSWRGALIIASGIHLHGFIFAALLRAPPKIEHSQITIDEKGQMDIEESSEPYDTAVIRTTESRLPANSGTLALFFICTLLTYAGNAIPMAYLPTLGALAGSSMAKSAFLVSIIGILGGIVRVLSGFVGLWLGTKYRVMVLITALSISAVTFMLASIYHNYLSYAVFAVAFGVISAFYVNYFQCMPLDLWSRSSLIIISSVNFSGYYVGSFVGTLVPGVVLDRWLSPKGPLFLGACVHVLSAVVIVVLLIIKVRCYRR